MSLRFALSTLLICFVGASAMATETQTLFTCKALDGQTEMSVAVGVAKDEKGLARSSLATLKVGTEEKTSNCFFNAKSGLFCAATIGDTSYEIYPRTYSLVGVDVISGVNVLVYKEGAKARVIRLEDCSKN